MGEKGTKGSVWSRASNLGVRLHKIAVKMRQMPHFCGNSWEARAASPAAFFPDVPLLDVLAGFWF